MSLKRSASFSELTEAKVLKTERLIKSEIKSETTCDAVSVKDSLQKIISLHTESSGDFATGFLLSDQELPVYPLIEINEYGILPLPINKSIFIEMKKFFKDSPYGLGEETLLDKSVRNSIQLDPSRFTITNMKFSTKLETLTETKIKDALGLVGSNVSVKPYKLLVYEKGGKFEAHRDTEKEDDMFGTMIVQLPSIFTGGDLVVTHNRKKRIFKNSEGSSTHCKVVAHYASCLHELQEITSGYRVALVYSLCWDGNGMKPSPYIASTNSVKLCNLMNKYLDNSDVTFICWGLDFEYSDLSITNGNISSMKGSDKKLVQGILNSIAYDTEQSGLNRFEVYIATANHKVHEYGDCSGHGYGRWGGGGCDSDWWETGDEEYYLKDFIPVLDSSAKISQNMKISLDFQGADTILNFDEDTDWGSDHGTGCSGPSGNEGASRDRWYKIKVLVMWRKEDAIALKCHCDLTSAIEHVYSLGNDGDIEESVEGLKVLMTYINKFTQDNLYKAIEICCKVKDCNVTLKLITKLIGIAISDRAHIISKVVGTFTWDVTKDAVLSLLKRCPAKQVQQVIYCCNLIDLDIITTLKILVDQISEENMKNKENTHDGYYYGLYNVGYSNTSTISVAYKHTVEFALNKNTFPSELMEKFLKNLKEFSILYSLIDLVVSKSNGDLFLVSLISHFVDMVFSKAQPELEKNMSSITEVIKLLHHHDKQNSLKKILDHIIALPSNQDILRDIVSYISSENKENLPESLMNACNKRLVHLQGIALRGKPKFSWNQPNAVISGHPIVEQFLRGPNERFTYCNFTGVRHARNWSSKHQRDAGCYMRITTGGIGKKAYADIVKTKAGYDKLVNTFNEEMKEYKRLIKVVPGHSDVTLIDSLQPTVSTVNNNDVTLIDTVQQSLSVSTGNKKSSSHEVIFID